MSDEIVSQVVATPVAEEVPHTLKIEAKVDTPTPEADKALEVVVVEYDSTDDPGLDVALEFVGRLGIGPEHAAMKAASNGDFAPLEAHLAAMGDKAKGFQKMVALGKQAFENGKKEHEAKKATDSAAEEKTKLAVYAAMGGEENWPSIQAWAAANATDTEKLEVSAAFKTGGMTAVAMAERLTNLYRKAGGTFKGKGAVAAGAASVAGSAVNGPLSPREFSAAVEKARGAHRGDFDNSKEYAALRARRSAWRG